MTPGTGRHLGLLLATLTLASSASARTEELRWRHPDPDSVAEFRVRYGPSSGSYDFEVPLGVPEADGDGVHHHDLVVPDDESIHIVMVAVGPSGLESEASNEIFRAGLPDEPSAPVPPPTEPPPPDSPPPSEEPSDPSPTPLPPEPAPAGSGIYRINVGGPAFVDSLGRAWETGDANYLRTQIGSIPGVYGPDVADTDLPELYWRERTLWRAGASIGYEFPVEPGEYVVRLHFAETGDYGPGERQFDVRAEGEVVFEALDIAYEVGHDTALVEELVVQVDDGALSLDFDHIGIGEPRISAIEVLAAEER